MDTVHFALIVGLQLAIGVLAVIAPRTATLLDDEGKALLQEILSHVKQSRSS